MAEIITAKQTGQGQFKMLLRQDVLAGHRELAMGGQGTNLFGGKARAGLFDTINTSYSGGGTDATGLFQIPISSTGGDPFLEWQKRCDYVLKLYYWDAVVGTSIDTLCDLISAGCRVVLSGKEATNKKRSSGNVADFYNWVETIGLNDLMRWSIRDHTLFGRAVPIRLGEVDGKNRFYTLYNPAHCAVLGALNVQFDDMLQPAQDTSNIIKVGVPADVLKPQNLTYMGLQNESEYKPPPWMKPFSVGSKDYYVFDPNVVNFIDRKKQPYSRYPVPFLLRASFSYRTKRIMQLMDEATAEDMVNCIVLVTVGNDKYPANVKQIREIQRAFETDKRSFTVYWNHTLNVQMLRPPAGEILGRDKYEAVNAELYAGIGVPMFLVDASAGGGGSGYSNQWVQVEVLLRRLDVARLEVKAFWERELNAVAQKFGIKERVHIVFDKVDLRPQDRFKAIVLGLRHLGLISGQTALEEAGHDPATEIARLEEELEFQKKGLFISQQTQTKMAQDPGRPPSGPGQDYPPGRQPTGDQPTPQA